MTPPTTGSVVGILYDIVVGHRGADADTDDHLRFLSFVAGQITAYLGACRLRELQAPIVSEPEAARATAEAGRARDVVLRVRDTGIEIAPAMLPRVLELFAQSDRPPAPAELGLALACSLTELHGGTIAVESDGPGRGSALVVRLPLGAWMALEDRDDRRRVAARHILLVDDDDNVRKALRRILELDGHHVEVARDGPEGVELTLATDPEIAFIDIRLPGIDGHEVARRIRAALGRRVQLVALTAHGREQDRRRSSAAGFDAHLVKPVSYEDLTRVLEGPAGGND